MRYLNETLAGRLLRDAGLDETDAGTSDIRRMPRGCELFAFRLKIDPQRQREVQWALRVQKHSFFLSVSLCLCGSPTDGRDGAAYHRIARRPRSAARPAARAVGRP